MTWSKLVSIMTWNKHTQTKGERLRTQHDETSVFCCASVLVCGVFVKLRVTTSWSSLLCKLVYVPVTSLTNESYVSQDNGKIRWIRKAVYALPRAVFKNKTNNMKTNKKHQNFVWKWIFLLYEPKPFVLIQKAWKICLVIDRYTKNKNETKY